MTETNASTSEVGDDSGRKISGAELRLEAVSKRYPGQKVSAVESLSLTIPAGEIVAFVGPSGCGKTTSLKMINRLIEPTSGTILLDGEDIRKESATSLRRKIGYVIQGGSLFPHMSVATNVGVVPKMLGWKADRISARVDELLDLVGLDPDRYRDRYPRELSGGQQQRVGVARGLAADPPVILMDEPFGAVDPITRQRLQDELISIQRELGKTIVCVTHDIDEAIKLGDRILILQEGAKIAQYDTPENILAAPANDFVADFVGAGSTLKQLSLTRVRSLELGKPTMAHVGDDTGPVLARAEEAGDAAIVVLDDRERPVAWPWLRQVRGHDKVRGMPRENLVTLDEAATLNDALDTMLTATHSKAIVTGDRDRYLGVIDFESVTEHMRQTERDAAERVEQAGHEQPEDSAAPAGVESDG
ncbi:osmoprotectant transport system ATP-binding protein [Nocardioides daedukensis]|uniref:ABC-type quaternary amine transporter n=1 Tax=Nocardioides daedukensis TaxID=634462 RepID=A0A7Y9RXF9_9ACTN|nr:ATP-binding cassette domain-containing protein [Nocardioides daedukensis]NYG57196.1 osmoprotectant transport system ATP-binding protein [Nocardioides daedukensis]